MFFIAGDLGWRAIEPYGSKQVRTPALAALFTANATCAPTRQQILTGLYPVRKGAYPNHSRVYNGVKGLPIYFSKLGCRVTRIGKKHFGPDESFPFEVIGDAEPEPGKMAGIDAFLSRDRGDASAYSPDQIEVQPHLVNDASTRKRLSPCYAEITWMASRD